MYRKSINESKGKPEHKFDVASGTVFTVFRISKCFKEASRYINFSLEPYRLKFLKSICVCTASFKLILKAFKKIFVW
jgi:hypothetical protein